MIASVSHSFSGQCPTVMFLKAVLHQKKKKIKKQIYTYKSCEL